MINVGNDRLKVGNMNISVVQSMINAIDKPAIFITPKYRILAVNEAYQETYEVPVILGTSKCYEISHNHISPCDKHGEDCPIQESIKTGKSSSVVHVHKTQYGKTFCDIIMKPVRDQDGMTIGYLEILDRISFASTDSDIDKMIGASESFKTLLTKVNRAASSDIAVLLHGETGTGKELVAKALHDSSKRSEKPFVVIECTGLNDNLFESELFGHEKGSFTGATAPKKGLIEIASGGTVFFDEIADVPLSMQVKLLRLFESRSYRTVGGVKQKKADFRLVCASHKNLLELVDKGEFRKDLYYRIAGFPISLPSLSERREDIPALANHFLSTSELRHKSLSEKALERLCQYSFPGNIRELKSIIEQSALLANEDVIDESDLPEYVLSKTSAESNESEFPMTLDEAERRYLERICSTQSIGIDKLAKQLGISTRTLYRKLQQHGVKYK